MEESADKEVERPDADNRPENDDMWLYGDANEPDADATNEEDANQQSDVNETPIETNIVPESEADQLQALFADDAEEEETPIEGDATNEEANEDQLDDADANDEEAADEEDSDDEDDIQVTIGPVNTTPGGMFSVTPGGPVNLNIQKRGPAAFAGTPGQSNKAGSGTLKQLDMDAEGSINGESIFDVDLSTLEDKPWRKPGADITDYFNYGFNEDSWKIYCERQKRLRAGIDGTVPGPVITGLTPNRNFNHARGGQNELQSIGTIGNSNMNENSKYGTGFGIKKLGPGQAGPPPPRKTSGAIDVIGGTSTSPGGHSNQGFGGLPSRRPAEQNGAGQFPQTISVLGSQSRPPMMPPPFGIPPPFPPPPGMEGFMPGMPPPMGMRPPHMMSNGGRPPLPFPPPDFMGRPPPGVPPPFGMPPPNANRNDRWREDDYGDRGDGYGGESESYEEDHRDAYHGRSSGNRENDRRDSSRREYDNRSSGGYREEDNYRGRRDDDYRRGEEDYRRGSDYRSVDSRNVDSRSIDNRSFDERRRREEDDANDRRRHEPADGGGDSIETLPYDRVVVKKEKEDLSYSEARAGTHSKSSQREKDSTRDVKSKEKEEKSTRGKSRDKSEKKEREKEEKVKEEKRNSSAASSATKRRHSKDRKDDKEEKKEKKREKEPKKEKEIKKEKEEKKEKESSTSKHKHSKRSRKEKDT